MMLRWSPAAQKWARDHLSPDDLTAVEAVVCKVEEDGPVALAPAGDGRVRAIDGRVSLIIDGDVIVCCLVDDGPRFAPASTAPTPASSRRRKPARRGPSSYAELRAWLHEAGYDTTTVGGSGHYLVRDPAGRVIHTLPATVSDHRALANSTSALRKLTGLALRAGASGAMAG